MYSVHDRVIVDNMYELQHSSSRASCESNAEAPSNKEAEKAHLPTDFWSVQLNVSKHGQLHLDHSRVSMRSSWLVYKHSMVPKMRLLSLSSSRFIGLLKVVRQVGRPDSFHEISHCLLLLLCSLLLLLALALLLALLLAVMIRSS